MSEPRETNPSRAESELTYVSSLADPTYMSVPVLDNQQVAQTILKAKELQREIEAAFNTNSESRQTPVDGANVDVERNDTTPRQSGHRPSVYDSHNDVTHNSKSDLTLVGESNVTPVGKSDLTFTSESYETHTNRSDVTPISKSDVTSNSKRHEASVSDESTAGDVDAKSDSKTDKTSLKHSASFHDKSSFPSSEESMLDDNESYSSVYSVYSYSH